MQWPNEARGRLHRDAGDGAREKCAVLHEKDLGSTGDGICKHLTVLRIELRSPGREIPRFAALQPHQSRRGRKSYQPIAEASQVLRGLTPEHVSGSLFNVPRQKHGRALCMGKEGRARSEEHTSELQSQSNLVCRLLLEKKKRKHIIHHDTHLLLIIHNVTHIIIHTYLEFTDTIS